KLVRSLCSAGVKIGTGSARAVTAPTYFPPAMAVGCELLYVTTRIANAIEVTGLSVPPLLHLRTWSRPMLPMSIAVVTLRSSPETASVINAPALSEAHALFVTCVALRDEGPLTGISCRSVRPAPTACRPSSRARAALQLKENCRASVADHSGLAWQPWQLRRRVPGRLMTGGGGTARTSSAECGGCWMPRRAAASGA